MKKTVLLTIFSIAVFSFTSDLHSSVTEIATDAVKTTVKQVIFHPIKSIVIAILAYDAYLHGIRNSLVFKTGAFFWQNGQQIVENGQRLVVGVKNVSSAAASVGSSAMTCSN